MIDRLSIIDFIRDHENWEEILVNPPYSLTVTRKEMFGRHLVMFKYSQIYSDFSLPIVRECRGLILDEDTLEVVSFPFVKFFNYGEPNAATIDFASAKCLAKIDGSLIKIVNMGNINFLISTNGTIDAFDATIPEQIGCNFKSFGELVKYILDTKLSDRLLYYDEIFKPGYTYMFELVSPFTRVVIPYAESDLYFLGIRDNVTFTEISTNDQLLSILFKTPREYSFDSFDACLKAARELPWNEEGYVVVDKDFNRVKVKSPQWVAKHHIASNGNMSYARAIDIIRKNEVAEVLDYFPNFKPILDEITEKYNGLIRENEEIYARFVAAFSEIANPSRKEQAIWIMQNSKIPSMIFSLIDHKHESVKEWLDSCTADKIVEYLGLKGE